MKKNIDKESVSHIRSCNCRRVSLLQLLEWERRDCSPQLIQPRMHGGECLLSQISSGWKKNFRFGEEKKKKKRKNEVGEFKGGGENCVVGARGCPWPMLSRTFSSRRCSNGWHRLCWTSSETLSIHRASHCSLPHSSLSILVWAIT